MKTMIKSTMKCVAIALCVLLAACTTDVYDTVSSSVSEVR